MELDDREGGSVGFPLTEMDHEAQRHLQEMKQKKVHEAQVLEESSGKTIRREQPCH